MKQYKIFLATMLLVLGAVLVGCGDTGGDATATPTEEVDVEMTEEMEDTDAEMEATEEADG